jgi:hypothetical protein
MSFATDEKPDSEGTKSNIDLSSRGLRLTAFGVARDDRLVGWGCAIPPFRSLRRTKRMGATSVVELVVSHPSHKNKGVARIRPTDKDPYVGTPGPGAPDVFRDCGESIRSPQLAGEVLSNPNGEAPSGRSA